MLIKEVSKKLLEGIESPLLQYGFILNKRKTEFKKIVSDNVSQILSFLFYKDHNGSILIEVQLKIRIKEIETIFNQVKSENTTHDDFFSLGNNLMAIIHYYEEGLIDKIENINSKYLIENKDDIETLIKVIPKRIAEYAIPYFKSYSSVSKVDELLNKNPCALSIHNLIYPIRACIAIIAAKLNKNPEFKKLIFIYEKELIEANPVNKEEFNKLKILLNSGNLSKLVTQ